MKRTQVYLPEELHQTLLILARKENTSISDLLRKGARKVIKEKKKKDESWKVMGSLAKVKIIGPKDLSKKHTEYYVKAVLGEKDER